MPLCDEETRVMLVEKTRPLRRRRGCSDLCYDAAKKAGGRGFEPRLADSESAVLPLDDPPAHFHFITVARSGQGSAYITLNFQRPRLNQKAIIRALPTLATPKATQMPVVPQKREKR